MTRAAFVCGALVLTLAPHAHGQRFAADAAVHFAEHRVDIGSGLEINRGVLVGVTGRARVTTRFGLRVQLLGGSLNGTETGNAPDRTVSQLDGSVEFRATGGVTLEAGASTRVYAATIASQRWSTAILGANVRVPFSDERIEALGRFALLPVLSVTDVSSTSAGFLAAAGVRARLGDVWLGLAYWLERYDFPPSNGTPRNELLSGVMLQGAWRPGRP